MADMAALRAKKAEREADRALEAQALEDEALVLEDKYETDGKKSGVDFAVVTTSVGNFVVSNPEFVVAKTFSNVDKKTIEDVTALVDPCVLFPAKEVARALLNSHSGAWWKLAGAALKLSQADMVDNAKK